MSDEMTTSDDPSDDGSFLERLRALQHRLHDLNDLESLSDSSHSEAGAVALGVLEIQRAANEIQAIADELVQGAVDQRIRDLMTDLGDLYREIDSHMRQMRYFSYLFEDEPVQPDNGGN